MDLDCESRAIFGVLMFGPTGIVRLPYTDWSLKCKPVVPQYFLMIGAAVVLVYRLYHVF